MQQKAQISIAAAAMLAIASAGYGQNATFSVGQKVFFEDVANRYGGGMIPGTIVEDRGPGVPDRYKVHVDVDANPAFQFQGFNASRLQLAADQQPSDAGGAVDRGRQDPQLADDPAPAFFSVGQKVFFEDLFNRYGGGWIAGTIVEDLGPSVPARYKVHVDQDANPAFQFQGFDASRLRLAAGETPAPDLEDEPIGTPSPIGPLPNFGQVDQPDQAPPVPVASGELQLGRYACREWNGAYDAVFWAIELRSNGSYVYRSNRAPEESNEGTFNFDPDTNQIAWTGPLQGERGEYMPPTQDRRYPEVFVPAGVCALYEGPIVWWPGDN